jgi:hypothetical protein
MGGSLVAVGVCRAMRCGRCAFAAGWVDLGGVICSYSMSHLIFAVTTAVFASVT